MEAALTSTEDETADAYVDAMFSASSGEERCDLALAEACREAAREMPWCHGLGGFELFEKPPYELKSAVARGRRTSAARTFAGTENDVFFFWVGTRTIPRRRSALVFGPPVGVKNSLKVAPWDTGGMHKRTA